MHVGPGHLHLAETERGRRHVREHEEIVVLQLGQVVGNAARRADVHLHVLLFECPGQMLGLVRVAVDQEHPRLAGRRHQPKLAIVVQERVFVALQPGRDRGQSPLVDRLFEDNPVFAFLERDRLAGDLDVSPVDLELPLAVVVIAVDQDLDIERLALKDLRRRGDGRELDLGVITDRQSGCEDIDLAIERRGDLEHVAIGRIAVG